MRSIWKGHLRFMSIPIPIRLYSAIEKSETISFHQLHQDCGGRVGYEKKCKKCQNILENKDIIKGYEFGPDQYVIMDDEDFQKVKLKSTRIIEIDAFVDSKDIPVTWFESPYYLGPDGVVAIQSFNLLREALRETNRVGVGKIVLRDREDVALIMPEGKGIVLERLYDPHMIRKIEHVPQLEDQEKVSADHLEVTRRIIQLMSKDISQINMRDRYQNALRELINAKIEGQQIISAPEEPLTPALDIMSVLKADLEKLERKPMAIATGQKAAARSAKAAPKAAKGKKVVAAPVEEEAEEVAPAKRRKRA
jgi:DNA end-binding protein Ku